MKKLCQFQGCDRPAFSRNWCQTHYNQWWARGRDAAQMKPIRQFGATLEARLLAKLTEVPSGCLEFTGWREKSVPGFDYGRIRTPDGRMVGAHRVAYELWVGPIPAGMFVCHRCDNPPCCNPAHLFLGTQGDNMGDMAAKGRRKGAQVDFEPQRLNGIHLHERAQQERAAAAIRAGHPADWKLCSRCDTFKAPADFGPNRRRGDGLQTYCHPCRRAYLKARKKGAP